MAASVGARTGTGVKVTEEAYSGQLLCRQRQFGSLRLHGLPLVYRDECFGRRWTVSQSAVRSDSVVVMTPSLDQDLGLTQAVKDLTVRKFVPEPGIEALAVAVFPR
mgnify:CR=1 FL=1